jgi:hypothetical protein
MLAQFAKLSLQRTMLRANTASVQSIRLFSGNGNIVPPSQPIDLGHLADNPGAVTEVIITAKQFYSFRNSLYNLVPSTFIAPSSR